MKPWEKASVNLGGTKFEITATPCKHVLGGECVGFVFTTEKFGIADNGKPNAIYFTGDTVYIDELSKIPEEFNIVAALMNLGNAKADIPGGPFQITMDGKQGTRLLRTLKADCLVPMHYESWRHFTQFGKDLAHDFEQEGIADKVHWLTPGKSIKIL
ncbi:hypothetical protein TRICI_006360 [Trichomonascus ciferrii]|uniref:Metallo-beta-lactamase domain-containing protein n=1 Tax=Trichomonascus ciferrii TaxID=44093 RepID=A0A642UJV9_9ASCO|nr:hypothetical protein TRICI_006360 [Trichomonascus ciferrii]